MKNSKSQVLAMDFTIAMLIFILLLAIYFTYTFNLLKRDATFNNLVEDGKSISSSLALGGYPENWTQSNIQRLGLTDNNQRIVNTQLTNFANLPYNKIKTLFNTQYDYFIFLKDSNNCLINISGNFGIGHPDVIIQNNANDVLCGGYSENSVNLSSINLKYAIRIDRILIYNAGIIDMAIYLWQK